jgi:anti-sigma B factor antagonist
MDPNMTLSLRSPGKGVCILDISGVVNQAAEAQLMEAYAEACKLGARAILLNFSQLTYMNSSGIGLLVTLLIRVRRQGQRLLACGLSDYYRQIFELTRLNEAIGIFSDENTALSQISGMKEVVSDG